jgi:hypothetical protein
VYIYVIDIHTQTLFALFQNYTVNLKLFLILLNDGKRAFYKCAEFGFLEIQPLVYLNINNIIVLS